MFCKNCGAELTEQSNFCPYCGSEEIALLPTHCRCCGAKLLDQTEDYCCEKCRARGEEMWRREKKKRQKNLRDPLFRIVRETETYNRKHGVHLSYGQFVCMKERGRLGR